MSINSVELYSGHSLSKTQSELSDKPEEISFDSERYHARGSLRIEKLIFASCKENDPTLLLSLRKENLGFRYMDFPFRYTEFHVYFIDTDYPILYKQIDDALYFLLPGSGVNYSDQELTHNSTVFSRVSCNYFGSLLSHDKSLKKMFRNFQFNGIDCSDIENIQINGSSLGGGMQHFLLVYILQNTHMFSSLRNIDLNMIAPACFHPKIITSLSKQFNDALSSIRNRLSIVMNYEMHLKDPAPRRGNPFALQLNGKSQKHDVMYHVDLYAYCLENGCNHQIQGILSNKHMCDIVPDGKAYEKYHASRSDMQQHRIYYNCATSDFASIQDLIDKFFLPQGYFDTFERFFFNTYGYGCLVNKNIHFFIFRHEKLADAILAKRKSECTFSESEKSEIIRLNENIKDLSQLEGVCLLRDLAKNQLAASERQIKWNAQYLELCRAKSELAKLITTKLTQKDLVAHS